MPTRNGKQIRDRYINILDPNINKSGWTRQEDRLILQEVGTNGPHWSEISKKLEGRPENRVKNRFYAVLKKRIYDKEIDNLKDPDIINKILERVIYDEESLQKPPQQQQQEEMPEPIKVEEQKENIKEEEPDHLDNITNVFPVLSQQPSNLFQSQMLSNQDQKQLQLLRESMNLYKNNPNQNPMKTSVFSEFLLQQNLNSLSYPNGDDFKIDDVGEVKKLSKSSEIFEVMKKK